MESFYAPRLVLFACRFLLQCLGRFPPRILWAIYSSHCHRAGGWGEGGGGWGGGRDVRACVCVCVSGVWTRLLWNDRHLLRPIKSHPKDLERLILFFSFGNPPTLLIASPDWLLSSNAAVDTPVRSRFCFGFCLAAVSATVLFVIAGKTNYLISDPDHDVGSSLFRGYNVTDRRHQWNTPQCSFSNTTKVSCFASRVSLCKYPPLRGTAYKVWLCWWEEAAVKAKSWSSVPFSGPLILQASLPTDILHSAFYLWTDVKVWNELANRRGQKDIDLRSV